MSLFENAAHARTRSGFQDFTIFSKKCIWRKLRSGLDGKRSPIFATQKRMIAIGANPSYSTVQNQQFAILAHASFLQKGRWRLKEKPVLDDSKDTTALWPEKEGRSGPGLELSCS